MRLVVFATDILPTAGIPSSGTALRTYGFIEGFRSHGWDVQVCVPKTALGSQLASSQVSEESRTALRTYAPLAFDHLNADRLLDELEPDAVYCGHWPAMCFRRMPNAPVIIDLAGPHMLERHYQGAPDQGGAIRAKLNNLASADLFIVSGKRQYSYFKSYFDRAGRSDIENRAFTIPMALDPKLPLRSERNVIDPKFLFAGIFLPWQDPSLGLRILVNELERRERGGLSLIGGLHSTYSLPGGVYESLFREIERSSRVSRKGLLPLDALSEEMLKADIALDLMKKNLERELAVTIRTTSYLWSGLPVIYNNYSDLSDLINKYGAGWTVDGEHELRETLEFIFSNPKEIQTRSKAAQELARNEFSWDIVTEPIVRKLVNGDCNRIASDILFEYPELSSFTLGEDILCEQEFDCRNAGLTKVQTKLNCQGISAGVTCRLLREENGRMVEIIRETHEIQKNHVNNWVGVTVPPIVASDGKRFRFEVRSNSKEVSPWVGRGTPYPLLSMKYRERVQPGLSMNLRTIYTRQFR